MEEAYYWMNGSINTPSEISKKNQQGASVSHVFFITFSALCFVQLSFKRSSSHDWQALRPHCPLHFYTVIDNKCGQIKQTVPDIFSSSCEKQLNP